MSHPGAVTLDVPLLPAAATTMTFAAIASLTAAPSVLSVSTPLVHPPPPRLMLMTFTCCATASMMAEAISKVLEEHWPSPESEEQVSSGVGNTRYA